MKRRSRGSQQPRKRRPRLGAGIAGVATLGLGLTSLSGRVIRKGSALAADVEEDRGDTPDAAAIETIDDNALPFLGSAWGALILDDGTPTDRGIELTGEPREHRVDHDDITSAINTDGVAFPVPRSEERNEPILELRQSPSADDRVTVGSIEIPYGKEDRWEVNVYAVVAEYPVVGGHSGPTSATVYVATGTDPAGAEALAGSSAPGLGDALQVLAAP